jgi:hypothetical protein
MRLNSKVQQKVMIAAGTLCALSLYPMAALQAEEDSMIARNLYSKPLTYRETPPGYRNKPRQHTPEPIGFRDNPLNWSLQPMGYEEKPLPQLDEPRNGYENPFNFVSRDGILVANLDESLKSTQDQLPSFNGDPDLRITAPGVEESVLQDDIKSRNPGYAGVNPPSKARLQKFQ